MENATRAAVGYMRVSTARQADEGISLEAQKHGLETWVVTKGWTLQCEPFVDRGLSGKLQKNRPALQEALDLACETKGVLVFYALSRLARSTRDALAMADRLQEAGADMASMTEPIDTTTSVGRFFFTFLAGMAQFERELIADRIKAALTYLKSQDRRCGQIPYGKRLVDEGRLVDDPSEAPVVARMREWRRAGHSLRAIAGQLDAAKIPAKLGGRWSPSSVRSVLIGNPP